MISSLVCAALGALVASLWWLGRLRRLRSVVVEWQRYAKDLQRITTGDERLLSESTRRIVQLTAQIRQLGYEPTDVPVTNGRKKGATR
jgi:hypothetical protein